MIFRKSAKSMYPRALELARREQQMQLTLHWLVGSICRE